MTYSILDEVKFSHDSDSSYSDLKLIFILKDSLGSGIQSFDPATGAPRSTETVIFDLNNLSAGVSYVTNGSVKELHFSMEIHAEVPKVGEDIQVHFEIWGRSSGGSDHHLILGQDSTDFYIHRMDTKGGGGSFFAKKSGQLQLGTSLDIYPNPFEDYLLLKLQPQSQGTFELRNLNGQLVLKREILLTDQMLKLNVRTLSPGVYIGVWKAGLKTEKFKIVKNP